MRDSRKSAMNDESPSVHGGENVKSENLELESSFVDLVRKHFTYDENDQVMRWELPTSPRTFKGDIVGLKKDRSFAMDTRVRIKGYSVSARTLAFIFHFGFKPDGYVYLIDGNPLNSSPENLTLKYHTEDKSISEELFHEFVKNIKINKRPAKLNLTSLSNAIG